MDTGKSTLPASKAEELSARVGTVMTRYGPVTVVAPEGMTPEEYVTDLLEEHERNMDPAHWKLRETFKARFGVDIDDLEIKTLRVERAMADLLPKVEEHGRGMNEALRAASRGMARSLGLKPGGLALPQSMILGAKFHQAILDEMDSDHEPKATRKAKRAARRKAKRRVRGW